MNTYKINHADNTITLSKAFNEKAGKVNTPEYNDLKTLRADFPNYTFKLRTIKRNTNKVSYRNLTYGNMKEYIAQLEGEQSDNLRIFDKVLNTSKAQPSPYVFVKKWFLDNYPNYRDSSIFTSEVTEDATTTDNVRSIAS